MIKMFIGLHVSTFHQCCGLNPYLFNIFMNDNVQYLGTEQTHSLVINSLRIPGFICRRFYYSIF
jgi:hypothetical protein